MGDKRAEELVLQEKREKAEAEKPPEGRGLVTVPALPCASVWP